MERSKLLFMLEVAIFAAIGVILDRLSFSVWPQGGSVSFAMVPIILMALRWGLKGGLLTGLLVGTIQVVVGGAYIIDPIQGALDYPIAFTVVGFAGLFAGPVKTALMNGLTKKAIVYIVLATLVGTALRYVCHVLSGVVFFSAGSAAVPALKYSLVYNGTFMGPAFILTAIVIAGLLSTVPRVATKQNIRNA
ncbi:energy-coupled thiamine transporter ThiT [Jeotgalibacillus soli]|uniref:Proton-coupled thiamine transporter YuaJ n=1 Tax=Jeotgalibacillus soli TaxID=889306 RepID=A0A0C2S2L3_9BACL|nr:energy-coupled thiamine transporter ThiT [Jeotgalibacillus soli]KIL48264.1 hypothetical protein KP78_17110 [Jeotgalibacillus soli]